MENFLEKSFVHIYKIALYHCYDQYYLFCLMQWTKHLSGINVIWTACAFKTKRYKTCNNDDEKENEWKKTPFLWLWNNMNAVEAWHEKYYLCVRILDTPKNKKHVLGGIAVHLIRICEKMSLDNTILPRETNYKFDKFPYAHTI